MSDIRRIAYNTIIQLVGKTLTIALGLVSFGIMTRYLGQDGYGMYATVYAFLAIFGIVVDLGLQMTTTQLISKPDANETHILSNALGMRLVSSALFLGLAPLMVFAFPYPMIVKLGVMIASLGFVFSSLVSTITSFFQKNLLMQRLVTAEIASKVFSLAVLVGAVYINSGLIGVITATVFDSAIAFALLTIAVRRSIAVRPAFNISEWKKIWFHTWPIALTIALNLIYFKGDIFIMSLMKNDADVGLYGAPYRVLEVLINVAYLFLGLLLPLLASAAATKNTEKFRQVLQAGFDTLLIVAVPLVVGGIIIGKPLMILIAGSDFALSGEIMKILLLATATIFIASLFGYGVVAYNRQREMIKFYAINAVFSIIAYTLAIYYYSYWGAAIVTVLTELFILCTSGYVLKRALGSLPSVRLFWHSGFAALAMAAALMFVPFINVPFSIVLGGIVYLLVLYAVGGVDKTVVMEIINIKSNGNRS